MDAVESYLRAVHAVIGSGAGTADLLLHPPPSNLLHAGAPLAGRHERAASCLTNALTGWTDNGRRPLSTAHRKSLPH